MRNFVSASSLMSHQTRARLPFIVWTVLFFTLLASGIVSSLFGIWEIFGFQITGLSWFVPMILAMFILVQKFARISFPWFIWFPWIALLLLYLVNSDPAYIHPTVSPLQRSIQLLSPLIVGMAISTYRPTHDQIKKFVQTLRSFAYLLLGVALLMAALDYRNYGNATMHAGHVITAMILGTFFINRYMTTRETRDIRICLLMFALPLFAVTRTVLAVMLLLPLLSFAPIGLMRRALFAGVVVVAGTIVFSLPQVQEKMFFSGQGTFEDISLENKNISTSGRSAMWEVLYAGALQEPWFGHGTGRAESVTRELAHMSHPHNDWLLTGYDYGVIGIAIFLLCNLVMLLHCLSSAKKTEDKTTKLFFLAGASSIIPFMLVMFTDNIVVYASLFGNLQYMIIGLAYGALRHEQESVQ